MNRQLLQADNRPSAFSSFLVATVASCRASSAAGLVSLLFHFVARLYSICRSFRFRWITPKPMPSYDQLVPHPHPTFHHSFQRPFRIKLTSLVPSTRPIIDNIKRRLVSWRVQCRDLRLGHTYVYFHFYFWSLYCYGTNARRRCHRCHLFHVLLP